MRIFYLLVVSSLVASQVVPTFGTMLGFLGNIIPIFVSSTLMIMAFLVRPVRLSKRLAFFVLIIGLAPVFSIIIGSLVIGGGEGRIFNDISKPIFLAFFVASGGIVAHATGFTARLPLALIISGFAINILLFLVFLIDVNSIIIELYRTRIVGGSTLGRARFVGAWNFPYNLSVFITAFMGAAIALLWVRRTRIVLFCFGAIAGCIGMVLFGQSRSALAAAILVPLFFLSLKLAHSMALSKRVMRAVAILVGAFVILGLLLFERAETLFTRLLQLSDSGLLQFADLGIRSLRVVRALDFFDASPISFLFGFSRDSDIFFEGSFESGVEYFVVYGLVGGIFFIVVPLVVSWIKSYRVIFQHKIVDPGVYFVSVFLMLCIFSVLVHSFGNTIFWHFRFMPLFGFLLGWMIALERHLHRSYVSAGNMQREH